MPRLLLALSLTVVFGLMLPRAAQANPARVANLFANGGPVVVVCAPGTCDSAAELRLQALGKRLRERTGGRVLVAYIEPALDGAVYTEAAASKGVAAKDLLVATDGKKWSVRSAAIPRRQLADLEHELAAATSVEAGVAVLVEHAPALQQDVAVVETNTPPPSGVSAPVTRAKQPTAGGQEPAASSGDDGGLPVVPLAAGLVVVGGGLVWWRRRRSAS